MSSKRCFFQNRHIAFILGSNESSAHDELSYGHRGYSIHLLKSDMITPVCFSRVGYWPQMLLSQGCVTLTVLCLTSHPRPVRFGKTF